LQLSADFRLVDLAGDRIEGERTSCGIREVRIGGKFCRSKSCATLMASTTRTRLFWLGELSEVLFVPGMGRMAK
jgi:hypothetical protein